MQSRSLLRRFLRTITSELAGRISVSIIAIAWYGWIQQNVLERREPLSAPLFAEFGGLVLLFYTLSAGFNLFFIHCGRTLGASKWPLISESATFITEVTADMVGWALQGLVEHLVVLVQVRYKVEIYDYKGLFLWLVVSVLVQRTLVSMRRQEGRYHEAMLDVEAEALGLTMGYMLQSLLGEAVPNWSEIAGAESSSGVGSAAGGSVWPSRGAAITEAIKCFLFYHFAVSNMDAFMPRPNESEEDSHAKASCACVGVCGRARRITRGEDIERLWGAGLHRATAFAYYSTANFIFKTALGPAYAVVFTTISLFFSHLMEQRIAGYEESVLTRRFSSLAQCCMWLCKQSGTAWEPGLGWNCLWQFGAGCGICGRLVGVRWLFVMPTRDARRLLRDATPGTAIVCWTQPYMLLRWLTLSSGQPTLLFVPSWQPVGEPNIVKVHHLGTMRRDGNRVWATRQVILLHQLSQLRVVFLGLAVGLVIEDAIDEEFSEVTSASAKLTTALVVTAVVGTLQIVCRTVTTRVEVKPPMARGDEVPAELQLTDKMSAGTEILTANC